MDLKSSSWAFCAIKKGSQRANHFDIILFKITHIFKTYKPQDLMRQAQQRKERSHSEISQSPSHYELGYMKVPSQE